MGTKNLCSVLQHTFLPKATRSAVGWDPASALKSLSTDQLTGGIKMSSLTSQCVHLWCLLVVHSAHRILKTMIVRKRAENELSKYF